MNAPYLLTTAMKTQTARILMVRSYALVTLDTLEMELFAKVSKLAMPFKIMHYHREIFTFYKANRSNKYFLIY